MAAVRKGRWAPLFFGLAAALLTGLHAPATGATQATRDALLREQVAAVLRDSGVPGAAVVGLRQGRSAGVSELALGVGQRDLLQPGAPAGANTWFKLGSLSKSVTALAVALLVEDGRLSWDAPLARAWPELAQADPRVGAFTLRQLLAHRSGLDLDRLELLLWPQPNAFTEADLLAGVAALRADPREAPGFHYSNVNYALVARVVARAAAQPFGEFVAQRVFAPLKMDCSQGAFSRAQRPDLAQPHRMATGRPVPVRTDPETVAEGLDAAAGGLRCSAAGLARWLHFHLSPQQGPPGLSEAGWRELHRADGLVTQRFAPDTGAPQAIEAYGLGLQFIGDARGLRIDHYGGLAGVSAYMAVYPERRLALAVALNGDSPTARARVVAALERALGLPAAVQQAPPPAVAPPAATRADVALSPAQAAAWQGRYRDAWFGELSVCPSADGSLRVQSQASPRLSGRLVQGDGEGDGGGDGGGRGPWLRWDDPSVQSDARLVASFDAGLIGQFVLQALGESDFDLSALRLRRIGACRARS